MKYQVIGLAIAVVIGGAVNNLVQSIVNDLIMPIVGVITPDGDWKSLVLSIGPISLKIGSFMSALLNFLIVAWVVFVIVKLLIRENVEKK